jgi:hypothetical protein
MIVQNIKTYYEIRHHKVDNVNFFLMKILNRNPEIPNKKGKNGEKEG